MNHLKKFKLYLRSIPHHLECGKHSNFRYCCVLDYSVLDNFNHSYLPKLYRTKRYANKVISHLLKKDFGYIPCAFCLLFREPRKVRNCRSLKHKWLMPMKDLKETVDWTSFNLLGKNLRKIEKIMRIIQG